MVRVVYSKRVKKCKNFIYLCNCYNHINFFIVDVAVLRCARYLAPPGCEDSSSSPPPPPSPSTVLSSSSTAALPPPTAAFPDDDDDDDDGDLSWSE